MAGNTSEKKRGGLALARRLDFNAEFETEEPRHSDEEVIHDWVDRLLDLDPEKPTDRNSGKNAVDNLGLELQRQAANQSEMLKQPIRHLSKQATEGGDVGQALVNLQVSVEKIDPGKFNFEPGWVGRLIGRVPGVGTPIKRYVTRYRTVQSVIDSILKSLERGRDQLTRDMVTLTEDQQRMRLVTQRLTRAADLAKKLDAQLQARLDSGTGLKEEQRTFLAEEVIFPLRQRVLDLQQQLAVNQQGVMASELIIRNNRELVRGVNRALNVTATALQVGTTVALALESQKRVLEQVNTVGKATSDLIAGTAARLKTQGTAIHRQAAGTTLNLESLRGAFADLNTAMSDLSKFRREALPQMASTILEFDKLTAEGEKSIRRMEQSRRAQVSEHPPTKKSRS
jgi:uncharacterized protein YaaN involved in tellurite resistance